MSKHNKQLKLSTMIIMVVTGIFLLALFIDLIGISGTFKYIIYYFLFLVSFFGISLWLKRNWICYLPTYFLIFLSLAGIIYLIIISDRNSFGAAIIFIFVIIAIILSAISYIAGKMVINYIIQNDDTNLLLEFKEQINLIAISTGLISWIRYALLVLKETHDFTYLIPLIIFYSILMVICYVIVVFILYSFDKIGKNTIMFGLALFMLYLPISYLIKDEYTKFMIGLALSNWLLFGTLLMIAFNNHKKNRPMDIHEEGEYHD